MALNNGDMPANQKKSIIQRARSKIFFVLTLYDDLNMLYVEDVKKKIEDINGWIHKKISHQATFGAILLGS